MKKRIRFLLITAISALLLSVLLISASAAEPGYTPDPNYFDYRVKRLCEEYPSKIIDHVVYILRENEYRIPPHYVVASYFDTEEAAQTATEINIVDEIDGIFVTEIRVADGTYYIGKESDPEDLYGPPFAENVTSIHLPKYLLYFGAYSYACLPNLEEYVIPDYIADLGIRLFYGLDNLTSVSLPLGVETIGDEAFFHCSNLKTITFKGHVRKIGGGAFMNCTGLKTVTFEPQYNVSTGLTIDDYAFTGCTALKKVTLPKNAASVGIGWNTFGGCTALKTIKYMRSVTTLDSCAFPGCKALTSVAISENARWIKANAFKKSSIKKLRILATDPSFLYEVPFKGKVGDSAKFLKKLPTDCKVYVKTEEMKKTVLGFGCKNKVIVKADLK